MGNEPEKAINIATRTGTVELKTTSESTPRPAAQVHPSIDLNITWLISTLDGRFVTCVGFFLLLHLSNFVHRVGNLTIDRAAKQCRTPRRNPQVEAALTFARSFCTFCENVQV